MAPKLVLPPMVPFPEASWRKHLVPEEWEACLEAWISLAEAHLSLSTTDFARSLIKDDSLAVFLISFVAESSQLNDALSSSDPSKAKQLRKLTFLLSYRLIEVDHPPKSMLQWQFLADISKVYGKAHAGRLLAAAWKRHTPSLEASIGLLKTVLIKELDAGLTGDLRSTEAQLKRLNHLLHASPEVAAFFIAGSDFVDSLISCYKIMNPPLRKVILSTLYLSLIGLTEEETPNLSSLVDQLYSLKTAAEAHRVGPTNVNDSLVAELVTRTPILKQVQQRIGASDLGSSRAKSVIGALERFRKADSTGRPHRLIRRKIDKGKGIAKEAGAYRAGSRGEIHIHRMSLVSQVQDLFPDLGSAFVVKLLDEYGDNVEQVIAHLLEGSLPSHLEMADRSEELDTTSQITGSNDLAPHSPILQLPNRRNVFDDDEFDQLAIDESRLKFGGRNDNETADSLLQDRSNAPNKAAILSALAAFDSDDDERDDTYDIEDVGGTVDSAAPGSNTEEATADFKDGNDEALFRAFKSTPKLFERDASTRRSKPRILIREETGMTDEAIEGWGLMLSRDPRQMRRLEAKFSTFTGEQTDLATSAWRASPAGSGTEDSDAGGNDRGRTGFRSRGGRGGGRGRGRGNVAGASGEKDTDIARQRKAANKGSRANHNRRDQRAKKMARGGFPN